MTEGRLSQNARSHGRGIREWAKKLEAIKILLGELGADRELAAAIYGRKPDDKNYFDNEIDLLAGSFKSWHDHDPKGATGSKFQSILTERLIERRPELRGDEAAIRFAIVKGSYEQFIDTFPIKTQDIIRANDYTKPPSSIRWAGFSRTVKQESIRTTLERGRVDQKFHYLTPDAKEIWEGVVNSGGYPQYYECRASLGLLCQSDIWRSFFAEGVGDGSVMLGCGAGSKDMLIIQSMLSLSPLPVVHYALVDFSPFMGKAAYHQIDDIIEIQDLSERVALDLYELDFVNGFTGAGREITRPRKNVAWMLPGGTLGNLDEGQFFDSLQLESKPGDMLAVGVETIPVADIEQLISGLAAKYDNPEVRRFVEMPFRSVLHAARIDKPPPISVNVVEGFQSGHSKIKGTATVELYAVVNNRKLVLLTSTRYNDEALIEFARQRGFEAALSVPSPLNQRFKQILFRRL